MERATLEKNPVDVAKMFDGVSGKYDLMNEILTFGLVKVWRAATREAIAPRPGVKVLDIAAGTGTSAASYAACGAEVIASDFSRGMITKGRELHPELEFVQADAMDLPFADESFDVTTISYGLRNVQEPDRALQEMFRVTKPGGRLVIAEFSRPKNSFFRAAYHTYLKGFMPLVAKLFSSNAPAYSYLFESIEAWPAQEDFARHVQNAGWRDVEFRNLTDGIVALHRATKPSA
ncbi:demethylmenaquinone methyltransferase/2-methoxy-6-polyprenyl-1,4-benzoquinol methylase [Trueperella bonasi]|uniref:Demethylmenaquinone methyltransferase n=1 Tax=Trueperella bonasi TaxID=312286 RepID=A0ABT9NH27_9ACTO|nr:demethylmenaquinone methyltransferase [Trueperella bonasi]MDP9806680.1 demethylmenaquinone methyltransferase/2-methoxy-6-polyprenyl-1,4-benzoquinol methylase [Trueperella bonasi]